MKKIYAMAIVILCLMTGCTSNENLTDLNKDTSKNLDSSKAESIIAEVIEGDFIYRLVSETDVYASGEEVYVYAELEYIGDKNKITISHAASPFLFPMRENTRDYEIFYVMNEPLLRTTIEKGKPLREVYGKSGGYSEKDEAEYIEFIDTFIKEGFPEGHYTVNGIADFFVADDKGENKIDYRLEATVDFIVER